MRGAFAAVITCSRAHGVSTSQSISTSSSFVISSAPGKQGHVEGEAARAWRTRNNAASTHLLLDPEGVVGKAYGAMTTPDMRVIDGEGRILFTGGIDDRPTNTVGDLEGANNFVRAALDDVEAGRTVRTAYAQPYGCSIKYPEEA